MSGLAEWKVPNPPAGLVLIRRYNKYSSTIAGSYSYTETIDLPHSPSLGQGFEIWALSMIVPANTLSQDQSGENWANGFVTTEEATSVDDPVTGAKGISNFMARRGAIAHLFDDLLIYAGAAGNSNFRWANSASIIGNRPVTVLADKLSFTNTGIMVVAVQTVLITLTIWGRVVKVTPEALLSAFSAGEKLI